MPNVIQLSKHRRHATRSGGYKSGRNSDRGIPVRRSTSRTRSAGTVVSQRSTVLLFTPNISPSCSSVSGGRQLERYARSGFPLDIDREVAHNATVCQAEVAPRANDCEPRPPVQLRMAQAAKVQKIHGDKLSHRRHYIVEWAERRQKQQVDIVEGLTLAGFKVDKSTVSRWFDGTVPREHHLIALAEFLHAGDPPDPEALFRHPDEDWLLRLFRQQSEDTRRTIIGLMEDNLKRRGAA